MPLEQSLDEGLSTLGWPVGVCVENHPNYLGKGTELYEWRDGAGELAKMAGFVPRVLIKYTEDV